MSTASPRPGVRSMLLVLEERKRAAQIALQRELATQAHAAEQLADIDRAMTVQQAARRARERQIYQQLTGRSLSAREITEFDAQLSQLERLTAALARQRAASLRELESARGRVQAQQQRFAELHRKRKKWDELSTRLNQVQQRRETMIDELAAAECRTARRQP